MCFKLFLLITCQFSLLTVVEVLSVEKIDLADKSSNNASGLNYLFGPPAIAHNLTMDDEYPDDDYDEYQENLDSATKKSDGSSEEDRRNRPIVDESGAVILNPFEPQASRKASCMRPLYGNTSSYSGFLVANEDYGLHLFFVFHVSDKNPKKAPLIVWLQGQPTLSVLTGYFDEHGPYIFEFGRIVQKRLYTWTREFNVLYLDHCAPCGYSFAKRRSGFIRTAESSAAALYNALVQFYAVFQEFQENSLYLAGEYSCGNIIPLLASLIHLKNMNTDKPIHLKGGMIGNGAVSVDLMVNYGKFWYHWGLLDPRGRNRFSLLEDVIEGFVKSNMQDEVRTYLTHHLFVELDKRGFSSLYDIRNLNETTSITSQNEILMMLLCRWMNVGNRTFHKTENLITMNSLHDVSNLIPDLLQHYKLLYYNGQFEMLFPYQQTSVYLRSIRWNGLERWYQAKRYNWYIDGQVLGYVKHYGNLTHVLVRNAGHMVGKSEPKGLFHLLKYFTGNEFSN